MQSSVSSSTPAAASSPHPCDVFLSHNSADDFAAAALEQRLRRRGGAALAGGVAVDFGPAVAGGDGEGAG